MSRGRCSHSCGEYRPWRWEVRSGYEMGEGDLRAEEENDEAESVHFV
jgi:hypothetical protein